MVSMDPLFRSTKRIIKGIVAVMNSSSESLNRSTCGVLECLDIVVVVVVVVAIVVMAVKVGENKGVNHIEWGIWSLHMRT
jgi:hypothetical protein